MYETCATCNQTHESYVREMPDGSSHVYQSAEALARRNRATIASKATVNAVLAGIPQWAVKMAMADVDDEAIESTFAAIAKRASEYAADGRDQYPDA